MVDIAVIMGSESDRAIANRVTGVLDESKYVYDIQVISAHRNPDTLDEYIAGSSAKVFIAIAGL
ncbi:AIR carboxylase family protein, partial [uncultured Methanomethylovorans sp.]